MKLNLIHRLILCLSSVLLYAVAGVASERPNILFIAVDDLRPELGCYGAGQVKTAHIDRLASQGITFNRAYCQVAVCGASRASLMTGLRPTPDRFLTYLSYAEKDAPGAMTLPEELKKNGYHTLSNGKIFHHLNDTAARSWSEAPWKPGLGGAKSLDPESAAMIGGSKNRGPFFEFPDVPDNAYPDGQVADKTIKDLQRMADSESPFFIACGFLKPHLPFYAPRKYWDLYRRDEIEVADNQFRPKNAPGALKGSREIDNYHNRDIERNSEEWHRSSRHGYYACVSFIDAQVGKILNALEDQGQRDNTIVILWGDHGFHLGEHNFWGKHNTMHLSTRSPLIISGPGIEKDKTSEALVEFVDIYPSLMELAGIKSKNSLLQGTSFKPLLQAPDRPWKSAAFSKFGNAVSVITQQFNYSEFTNGEIMLYDLSVDPDENTNVAGNPEYLNSVSYLSGLLESGWRTSLPPQIQ